MICSPRLIFISIYNHCSRFVAIHVCSTLSSVVALSTVMSRWDLSSRSWVVRASDSHCRSRNSHVAHFNPTLKLALNPIQDLWIRLLVSIPAFSDMVESVGRQMNSVEQCTGKNRKKSLFNVARPCLKALLVPHPVLPVFQLGSYILSCSSSGIYSYPFHHFLARLLVFTATLPVFPCSSFSFITATLLATFPCSSSSLSSWSCSISLHFF